MSTVHEDLENIAKELSLMGLFQPLDEGVQKELDELSERLNKAAARLINREDQLTLHADELRDLPEDLIAELSIDKNELLIIEMMDKNGGAMTLDQILIGLFRRTGEVLKRATLNSKLYRMSQKGLLYSVPGKKGAYTTVRPEEYDGEEEEEDDWG